MIEHARFLNVVLNVRYSNIDRNFNILRTYFNPCVLILNFDKTVLNLVYECSYVDANDSIQLTNLLTEHDVHLDF